MLRKGIARPAAGMKMRRRNSRGSDLELPHLPQAVLLVLVGEKPKAKKKRAGSAGGASSRPRMDRARRQAGGAAPAEASLVGPRGVPLPGQYRGPGFVPSPVVPSPGSRGLPLPVQRGPGLPQAPVSAADVQRMRLLALQRARGGI
jgi:hypothetical protein